MTFSLEEEHLFENLLILTLQMLLILKSFRSVPSCLSFLSFASLPLFYILRWMMFPRQSLWLDLIWLRTPCLRGHHWLTQWSACSPCVSRRLGLVDRRTNKLSAYDCTVVHASWGDMVWYGVQATRSASQLLLSMCAWLHSLHCIVTCCGKKDKKEERPCIFVSRGSHRSVSIPSESIFFHFRDLAASFVNEISSLPTVHSIMYWYGMVPVNYYIILAVLPRGNEQCSIFGVVDRSLCWIDRHLVVPFGGESNI
jgi:hypothetical protein